MATATAQARYRAHDDKRLVQVRLTRASVAVLDRLVTTRQASGRAEVLEGLLAAPTKRDALALARRYLVQTGQSEISGTDAEGYVVDARRLPPKAPTWRA